jgi:hypothetical protein
MLSQGDSLVSTGLCEGWPNRVPEAMASHSARKQGLLRTVDGCRPLPDRLRSVCFRKRETITKSQ